jgi:cytoskeletal protein CcmA (bactofilin family)
MNRPLKYFANGRDLCLIGDNLSAMKKLTRRSFLIGDVTAARISVENGAFFKGGIDIKKAEAAPEAPKPIQL